MSLESVTTYPRPNFAGEPGTALWHVSTRVPTAAPDDRVSQTLDGMRGRHFDSAATVAVLDDDRVVGVATIERMLDRQMSLATGAISVVEGPIPGTGGT
jgi:magnesium transporter